MGENSCHVGPCLRVKAYHHSEQLPETTYLLDRECLKTYRVTVKFPELVFLFAHQHIIQLVINCPLFERHSSVDCCKDSNSQGKYIARHSIISWLFVFFCVPNFRGHEHLASSELIKFFLIFLSTGNGRPIQNRWSWLAFLHLLKQPRYFRAWYLCGRC